ncbi:MAG: hypothetical protein V3R16_08370, partial [Nitrospirales bacterium]
WSWRPKARHEDRYSRSDAGVGDGIGQGRSVHRRPDGKGGPTFDSLITGRGGRPPITVEDALKRISSEAGTEFDPSLTTVFAKVVNDCQGSLPAMAMLPNQAPMQDIPGESGAS